jgi:TonB family protein
MAETSAQYAERAPYGEASIRKALVISIILHVLVFVAIPLSGLLWPKPKKFERPQTFQLVSAPIPPAPKRKAPVEPPPEPVREQPPEPTPPPPTPIPTPAPVPKPVTEKPTPRKETAPKETPPPPPKPEPVVREVEENLDDLAALFDAPPAPAQVSAPSDFKFHWYLNNVRNKIESNWRPPTEDRKLEVVVRFIINSDGSAADISVAKSSGNSTLDNLAVRAVTVASPFGKLPPGFSGDKLDISCTLRPTRK